jgi:hypothetical protein
VVGDPQEAIRVAEVYQEYLALIKDSPEVQVEQGTGALLWQQAQLLMKQMQDNPDLIITPRVPTDIREGGPTEPGNPYFTNLGNINGSDGSESTASLVRPPAGGMTQPETGKVLFGTCVPNPLSKLINIYNDDEIPESSHDTPVHVQEEKGSEKTSSLSSKFKQKRSRKRKQKSKVASKQRDPLH